MLDDLPDLDASASRRAVAVAVAQITVAIIAVASTAALSVARARIHAEGAAPVGDARPRELPVLPSPVVGRVERRELRQHGVPHRAQIVSPAAEEHQPVAAQERERRRQARVHRLRGGPLVVRRLLGEHGVLYSAHAAGDLQSFAHAKGGADSKLEHVHAPGRFEAAADEQHARAFATVGLCARQLHGRVASPADTRRQLALGVRANAGGVPAALGQVKKPRVVQVAALAEQVAAVSPSHQ